MREQMKSKRKGSGKLISMLLLTFTLGQICPVQAATLAPESLIPAQPVISAEKAAQQENSSQAAAQGIQMLAEMDSALSEPTEAVYAQTNLQTTPDGKHQVEYTGGVMIVRRAAGNSWQEVGRLGMCTSVTCVNGFSATNSKFYIEGRQRSSQFVQSYEYDNFPGPGSPVNLPAEVRFTGGSDFEFVEGEPAVADIRGSDWVVRRVNIETGEILSAIKPSKFLGTQDITKISTPSDRVSLGVAQTYATSRGAAINYDTTGFGWSGGGFSFNRLSTAATEVLNLNGLPGLVIGLRGTSPVVKIEIKDKNGKIIQVQLSDVSATEEKVWIIPNMVLYSIDPGSITEIFAIVEGAALRGTVEISLMPAVVINPSTTLKPTNITALPAAWPISGTNTDRGISMSYDTTLSGYSFGGFNFDNPTTPALETANLSGLPQIVLGFYGDAEKIKLEVTDSLNRRAVVYLNGIQKSTEKVWVINASDLAEINLSKIKTIFAVVEAPLKTGKLQMNRVPAVYTVVPSGNLSAADVTAWPTTRICSGGTFCEDRPVAYGIAQSTTAASTVDTSRGVILTYNTGTVGWAGVSHSYDANATYQRESADFSAMSQLVLGLKGNASQVKMEFVDVTGKRSAVYLGGVSATEEKIWAIQLSQLSGIDLKKISWIDFVVEGQNQKGTLELTRYPSFPVLTPSPVSTANLTPLIQTSSGPAIARVAPDTAVAAVTAATRGEFFQYDTKTAGWAGGGFTWDNFATPGIETASFLALNQITLGLKGSASQVKVEFIDAAGKKASVLLSGISKDQEKVWVIPTALLKGIDKNKIRLMYVIVEGNNQKGFLEINHKPVPAPALPSGWARTTSNVNFAFQFRVNGPNSIAVIRDLRTGREYEVAKTTASRARVAAIDVAADGNTVMTIVNLAGYTTNAFDINFQKLDNSKPRLTFKADYRGYSLTGNSALIHTLQGDYKVDLLQWRIL